MYDLAINVYNFIKKDDESMIYYILTKNAMMDGESIQCVSEPLDADLAAELRGENIVTEDPEAGSSQNDLEQKFLELLFFIELIYNIEI